ncbi:hypothetical protein [Ideonella sp. YS5]|uniref:hypothetical protein n=1 Tax=Ideonella sp. YS5 TaxID=3453714 RepID=UPI003EEBED65
MPPTITQTSVMRVRNGDSKVSETAKAKNEESRTTRGGFQRQIGDLELKITSLSIAPDIARASII